MSSRSVPQPPTINHQAVRSVPPPSTLTAQPVSGRRTVFLLFGLMALFALVVAGITLSQQWRQNERLIAGGLRSPRGATLMPDGAIVVAEAGIPESDAGTDGAETLVSTGRLTWVHPEGSARGTLLGNLPGRYVPSTDQVLGPVAVAPWSEGRYLLLMGGCGGPRCAALLAVERDGTLTTLADLSAAAGPRGMADQRQISSNPYGMVLAPDGRVYVSDTAADTVLRVDPAVRPASVVVHARLPTGSRPMGLALAPSGTVYAALSGVGQVARIAPDGAVTTALDGLSAPVGIAVESVDGTERLLVLELAERDAAGGYLPGTGRLLRVDPAHPGEEQVLSAGLAYPTALLRAPDGRVFVSVGAFVGSGDESGQLLQIRRLGPQRPRRYV